MGQNLITINIITVIFLQKEKDNEEKQCMYIAIKKFWH